MEWMDELEKAVRRAPDMDADDDGEGEGEGGEEEGYGAPPMAKKCVKSTKPEYAPADNGDDETEGDEGVHSPETLDNANQKTGKKQAMYPKTRGSVKKSLADEHGDAIDASEVLESLVKSIDRLAADRDAEVAALRAEVASLSKGLGVIGRAVAKSLRDTGDIAKSLTAQVEEMGKQPAGRKGVVRAIEKSFGGNNETPQFPDKAQRMAKSMAAIKAGTVSPVEVSLFEASCNRGEFRQDIWRKMGGE